jgi:hypothetical protein
MNVTEVEIWRDIPNFIGLYQASNLGRIRVSPESPRIKGQSYPGKVLKPIERKYGYLCISLISEDGKRTGHTVNRLVALAFFGEPPNCKYQAAHLDGSKKNNNIKNLVWATSKENCAHKIIHGTAGIGIKNGRSKVNEEIVREIRQKVSAGMSRLSVSKQFNISNVQVANIVDRISWKHVA